MYEETFMDVDSLFNHLKRIAKMRAELYINEGEDINKDILDLENYIKEKIIGLSHLFKSIERIFEEMERIKPLLEKDLDSEGKLRLKFKYLYKDNEEVDNVKQIIKEVDYDVYFSHLVDVFYEETLLKFLRIFREALEEEILYIGKKSKKGEFKYYRKLANLMFKSIEENVKNKNMKGNILSILSDLENILKLEIEKDSEEFKEIKKEIDELRAMANPFSLYEIRKQW